MNRTREDRAEEWAEGYDQCLSEMKAAAEYVRFSIEDELAAEAKRQEYRAGFWRLACLMTWVGGGMLSLLLWWVN